MAPAALFVLAVIVKADRTPLRAGCDPDAAVVAQLAADTRADVSFAIAGDASSCYKVRADFNGKTVEGYLPRSAVANAEEFERERRSARIVEGGTPLNEPPPRESQKPGEASTLAAAGMAAWRSDDSRQALVYWKESLALQPNVELSRLYHRVEKEVAGDESKEKLYGMHFSLRYEGGKLSDESARRMVAAMDEEFTRVSEQIGCPGSERIVAIVQSRQAYLKSTDAAEWSAAQYDGRIHLSLVEGGQIGAETRRMLAHEIVHACLAALGRWPAWLHEGLAQRLSGEALPPSIVRQLDSLKKAHALPRLGNLSQDWSRMDAQHARIAYALALQAVDALYDRYGYTAVRNLINDPGSLPRVAAELDRQLGL